jgi:hypothetical protein
MLVTGLRRMGRTSDTKLLPKKKLYNNLKKMRMMRRKKKHVETSNFQK